jgi:hypothetical protein
MTTQILTANKSFKFQLNAVAEIPKATECSDQADCFPITKRFGWVDRSATTHWLGELSPCDVAGPHAPLDWYKCSAMLCVGRAQYAFCHDVLSRGNLSDFLLRVDSRYLYYMIPLQIDVANSVWTLELAGTQKTPFVWSYELVDPTDGTSAGAEIFNISTLIR